MATSSCTPRRRGAGVTLGVLLITLAGLILVGWASGTLLIPAVTAFDTTASARLVVGAGAATDAWQYVSLLGSGGVIVVAGLALCVVLIRGRALDLAICVVVGVLGSAVLSRAVKVLVDRPRPQVARVTVSGQSFPSGHATESAAFYGVLMALAVMLPVGCAARRAAVGGCGAVMVAVAYSRLALGVHFPSDVIAGLVLGGVWAAVTIAAVGPGGPMRLPRLRVAQVAASGRHGPAGTTTLSEEAPLWRGDRS